MYTLFISIFLTGPSVRPSVLCMFLAHRDEEGGGLYYTPGVSASASGPG